MPDRVLKNGLKIKATGSISLERGSQGNSPLALGAQVVLGGRAPLCPLRWNCRHRLFLPGGRRGREWESKHH